ncbi:MAG: phytanoyl-CoA dioxygenase family protein [Planctomicrobium sp.]|jgi:phytanoyl-CoA hydroxylase|nr:phytanoyl-CoA dioxygenase family protein [Planctomicrobium sp.]
MSLSPETKEQLSSAEMTQAERMHFEEHGYVILRHLTREETVNEIRNITLQDCDQEVAPIEFEADLKYPGAPDSLDEFGGKTIRRLKQAHSRGIVFTDWLTAPNLVKSLQQILGQDLVCPLAHHNCIMTKEPRFSSDTGWHQDIRYWSFTRPDLVSTWLALGNETKENGCLQLIPGSHRMTFGQHQFDSELFFRSDLPENQAILDKKIYAELAPGDVLLFHARTLHAASRNHSDETKYALVFTFRSLDNPPKLGTRTAESPEILIH